MNFGRSSAISFIRSGRRPFGVFWYVGGNSETRLNDTLPVPPADRTNRALHVVGASCAVLSVIVYFFHAPVTGGVSPLATVRLPSSARSEAVTEPANPPPPLV